MSNVVRVPPWKFQITLNEAIEDELNEKLANKVFLNVGLCISLFDITKLGNSYIIPGDGSSHTKVEFRYVIFRPFIDEILIGKIRSCSREGVQVTLDFFDDILIPPEALQHPSRFDDTEQAWVWEYDVGEGEKHDLFMDAGEKIRIKITSEIFEETCPVHPDGKELTKLDDLKDITNKVPYKLQATINEPGLGLLTWWAKS